MTGEPAGPLETEPPRAPPVTRSDIFLGFLKIGLLGFGGVAPWARYVIVEERRWLSEAEYAALLGFGQILPGPNVMNAAVMIGDRFQGPAGSALALAGIMAMPLLVLIALAQTYNAFSTNPVVQAALAGSASAAGGLVIGTAWKMAERLRPTRLAILSGLLAVAAIAVFELPLLVVVAVLGPLSVAAAAWESRP